MSRRKRSLSKAELRAAGITPGLVTTRYTPDGRARLEQLSPEGPDPGHRGPRLAEE